MPPASRRAGTAVRSWSPESPRRSPGDDRLRDLGEHRLKDLSAPERVYQLGADDFPPLKSLYQTNLPVPSTPFLGREEELSRVLELLGQEEVRLLTLTGPGGTGKTRLALQAAGSAADAYPAGVWWVSLSPLRDSDLVLATASQALGASGALTEHIGSKRMLILFDNFEHVIDAASGVGELLQACPELDVLATSREHLHLAAEREYAVPPLNPPEGVAFFSARAQAVRADFEADGVIEEICRRLDDLPLALELAAARVKALSPAQILASGWNILVRHTQQRFWMLESIREYAAEQLAESDEADELRNGHALHFLGVAESTGLSLEPLVEQHYDVAAGEIDNLRAALVWLSEKDAELALRLATALDAFWLVTDPSEGMRWYAALLERAAEAPPELRARALLAYGGSANPAGDDELAERLYQQSHDLFREVGNDEGVAVTLLRLGYSAFYRGDSERAASSPGRASTSAARSVMEPSSRRRSASRARSTSHEEIGRPAQA